MRRVPFTRLRQGFGGRAGDSAGKYKKPLRINGRLFHECCHHPDSRFPRISGLFMLEYQHADEVLRCPLSPQRETQRGIRYIILFRAESPATTQRCYLCSNPNIVIKYFFAAAS